MSKQILSQKPIKTQPKVNIARLDTKNQILDINKRNATRWYRNAVNGINTRSKIMPEGLYKINRNEYPPYGMMALYGYDAKYKDKLPYWDAFPLIIVTNIRGSGFSGFNLHYMPLRARKEIVKFLIHHKNKSASPILYARRVVPLLSQISKSDIAFCYKNYLYTHVKTNFVLVGNEYWELASELPLQQFNKATDKEVWADRLRKQRRK